MIQQILVTILVLVAFAFSAWRLMPARRRLQILVALDRWAAGHAGLAGWRERALKPRILRAAGTGCDGCAASDSHARRSPR
jgi:hypothetical protein